MSEGEFQQGIFQTRCNAVGLHGCLKESLGLREKGRERERQIGKEREREGVIWCFCFRLDVGGLPCDNAFLTAANLKKKNEYQKTPNLVSRSQLPSSLNQKTL